MEKSLMRGFLLDTNIFNHLVEGKIHKEDLPVGYPIFVTSIQHDEIARCPDIQKCSELCAWLQVLPDHRLPLETLVWDVGHWDDAKFSDGKLYEEILVNFEMKKRRKNNANVHDALIAEVTIKNEMVLVTNDSDLADVVKIKGGYVRNVPHRNVER